MPKIFIGVDERQPLSANVLASSINETASFPVSITQLRLKQLPIERRGLTDFTFARYLVPYLCEYKGKALFLDSDQIMVEDVNKLFSLYSHDYAVQIVQSEHRFEWPSVMLFNNAKCKDLTPEYIDDPDSTPQDFSWAHGEIGDLPKQWNHLVGYDDPIDDPCLLHYTAGIPMFNEVLGLGYEPHWFMNYHRMKQVNCWIELMGNSVHAELVMKNVQKRMDAYGRGKRPS